jgi:hypothetical protein
MSGAYTITEPAGELGEPQRCSTAALQHCKVSTKELDHPHHTDFPSTTAHFG